MTWATFSTTLLIVAASVYAQVFITLDSVNVPREAKVGTTVTLECPYSINHAQSPHTVKWDRNNEQFYQFPSPKGIRYLVDGITVHLAQSNARQVTLRLGSVAASGRYQCEVILDETSVSTSRASPMTVSEEPPPVTAAPKPVTTPKPPPKPIAPRRAKPAPKRSGASGMMGEESLLHKVLLTLLVAAIACLLRP